MIDATHLKGHQAAVGLRKGILPRRIGCPIGGLNSKLHAVCDGKCDPLIMLLREGQSATHSE